MSVFSANYAAVETVRRLANSLSPRLLHNTTIDRITKNSIEIQSQMNEKDVAKFVKP
jgi:hypothetical protein